MGKHNWADMDTGGLIWKYFFLISVCVCAVSGTPIATTVINCDGGGNKDIGPVDEGFSGDVELVTGITAGSNVKLVPYIFPDHLKFLKLIFTVGETSATVHTRVALDAELLIDSNSTLYYSIMCDGEIKYHHTRKLKITDRNDNVPVFEQPSYNKTVSEAEPVNTTILQVKAIDIDITPAYNEVTYSMEPTSEDFMMTSSGALILKRPLNYTLVKSYGFTVTAKDSGGFSDRASIQINVKDVDNLNPHFIYSLYYAFIPENQVGFFSTIKPEAIKALDGCCGINTTLTYSINAVDPEKYRANFNIDSISGVVSVVTAIDREEINNSTISVNIKVLAVDQVTGGLTATAQVRVQVEDVNEAPQFPPEVYKASVFSTDPYKTPVIQVKASDPDVEDEGRLEYSMVSGSPYFDVDASSGLVFVVSVVDLSGQAATVEVKVTDPKGLHATAKVEVEVLGSTSSNDVVTISLNQPANVVERNIPEMEKSLGKALGWTVNIIEVSNSTRESPKSRTLREAANCLVDFIAVDKVEVVSYEEVVTKLQSESAAVTDELTKVFGEDVRFAVVQRPEKFNWQAVVISLSVIVSCSFLVLTVALTRSKRKNKKANDEVAVDMDKLANEQNRHRNSAEYDITFKMDKNLQKHRNSAEYDITFKMDRHLQKHRNSAEYDITFKTERQTTRQ